MGMKPPRFGALLGISAAVAAADQAAKWLVAERLALSDSVAVLPFFNLVRWHNTGAAFGLLSGASGWQNGLFLFLGLGLTAFLGSLMRQAAAGGGGASWALGLALMTGGAAGNIIDRVARGHVLDFVSLHYRGWAFPAFNVADSAITAGVVLILFNLLAQSRSSPSA